MVSLYTDESRLKRYEILLRQREKCDEWLGKSLLFSGVVALAESLGNILTRPMSAMLRGQLEANSISTLIVVLVMAFCVFSIMRRDYRLMLAAMVGVVLCLTLGFYTQFQIGAIQIVPLCMGDYSIGLFKMVVPKCRKASNGADSRVLWKMWSLWKRTCDPLTSAKKYPQLKPERSGG